MGDGAALAPTSERNIELKTHPFSLPLLLKEMAARPACPVGILLAGERLGSSACPAGAGRGSVYSGKCREPAYLHSSAAGQGPRRRDGALPAAASRGSHPGQLLGPGAKQPAESRREYFGAVVLPAPLSKRGADHREKQGENQALVKGPLPTLALPSAWGSR